MERDILIKKITEGNPDKTTILTWIRSLPNYNKLKPSTYKKGDILMHPIFAHPYILIEYHEDRGWICCMLTSKEECDEVLVKCNSRFLPDSYVTKMLFTINEPVGSYMGPYENNTQLNSIIRKLKKIFK